MLSRDQLMELGRDLNLPGAWIDQAQRATAAVERHALLRQLRRRLLTATEHGRARLHAWNDRQRANPSAPLPSWLLRAWVRDHCLYSGDAPILEVVVEALVAVPAPVRDAALDEVAFEGVGADSVAWTGSSQLLDRHGNSRERIVNYGPNVDVPAVAHELGHCWHSPKPHEFSQAVTLQGEERLFALAKREGWIDRAEAFIRRGELIAEACKYAWV